MQVIATSKIATAEDALRMYHQPHAAWLEVDRAEDKALRAYEKARKQAARQAETLSAV